MSESEPKPSRTSGNTSLVVFAVTSIVTFLGLIGIAYLTGTSGPATSEASVSKTSDAKTKAKPPKKPATIGNSFAELTGAKECAWDDGNLPTKEGARLGLGTMRLKSGVAEIRFDLGTVVVLEGPAVFEIKGKNNTYLHSGKLVAHVPDDALGFEVETPAAKITDLGMEVEARPDGGRSIRLEAGQSGRIGPDGVMRETTDPPTFGAPPEPEHAKPADAGEKNDGEKKPASPESDEDDSPFAIPPEPIEA